MGPGAKIVIGGLSLINNSLGLIKRNFKRGTAVPLLKKIPEITFICHFQTNLV